MRIRLPFLTMSLILAVAACTKHDPVADNVNGNALPPPAEFNTADATGTPPKEAEPTNSASPPASPKAAAIPAALQGRWGLTPADCTSTRGDAKGLLTISADELRFYESRARPAAGVEAHPDRISGDFNFTGEGMTWTKFQALKASGEKLVRTETNPAASFAYAKC